MSDLSAVWVGFDPREVDAYAVARWSARRWLNLPVPIRPLILSQLQEDCLYCRPTSRDKHGRLWDEVSQANMSTEFALTRFLVPFLMRHRGWALFVDADVMFRRSLRGIMRWADHRRAVVVVDHDHQPTTDIKMDGQVQTAYPRKNWSSVMLINCEHPGHRRLTLDVFNQTRGLHLHQFCWLRDDEIGHMPTTWNWLVGESPPDDNPSIVHFTNGVPSMPGRSQEPFADEWRACLESWAS